MPSPSSKINGLVQYKSLMSNEVMDISKVKLPENGVFTVNKTGAFSQLAWYISLQVKLFAETGDAVGSNVGSCVGDMDGSTILIYRCYVFGCNYKRKYFIPVGAGNGSFVGSCVGCIDGEFVGLFVGDKEGCMVGCCVGCIDGEFVGVELGEFDKVGSKVGSIDGEFVDFFDGDNEGSRDG